MYQPQGQVAHAIRLGPRLLVTVTAGPIHNVTTTVAILMTTLEVTTVWLSMRVAKEVKEAFVSLCAPRPNHVHVSSLGHAQGIPHVTIIVATLMLLWEAIGVTFWMSSARARLGDIAELSAKMTMQQFKLYFLVTLAWKVQLFAIMLAMDIFSNRTALTHVTHVLLQRRPPPRPGS